MYVCMHVCVYIYIYMYICTSVLLCIYTQKSGWAREVRGRMTRIIDVEYKRIGNTNRKLFAYPFSTTTQTRKVDQKGSELTTREFVTQVCFVGVQASQKMSARQSHGDGSDCPLCSLHDGDLSSLQGAQRLSLFGNEIQKIHFFICF